MLSSEGLTEKERLRAESVEKECASEVDSEIEVSVDSIRVRDRKLVLWIYNAAIRTVVRSFLNLTLFREFCDLLPVVKL